MREFANATERRTFLGSVLMAAAGMLFTRSAGAKSKGQKTF